MNLTTRRRLIGSAVLVLAAISLFFTPAWRGVQGAAQRLLNPVVKAVTSASMSAQVLLEASSLAQENDNLRQLVATLSARESQLASLALQNQELRLLNQMALPPKVTALGVEVIGREQDENGTSYLLNRGSADGLTAGMPVVAGTASGTVVQALLVGTVSNVSPHSALFNLTTSNNSQVLAGVENATHSQGLAVGEYNLAIRLKFIPLTEKVTPGDMVVTNNLDPLTPSGLLIGKVTAVEQIEGDFYLSAIVAPPEALDRFRFLYVLQRQS